MKDAIRDELSDAIEDYNSLSDFVKEYSEITVPEFDYYSANKLSLFLVHENYDFDALRQVLDKIDFALPSIKRIFQKPIIHLKEEDELVPVEAVKLVNNNTINHISTHSELWDDVNEEGIKPLKLLTRAYRDNYNIYENQVFAKTVDCIISYLRKNMRYLKSLMYSSSNMEFNLLERVNHPDYFIAIGKLHTGYIRSFSKSYDDAKECFDRMDELITQIISRRKRKVYYYNRNYGNFSLHSSNILMMQKDYHRVYVLLKRFKEIKADLFNVTEEQLKSFNDNYFYFCKVITVFAILHMNFRGTPDTKINLNHLDTVFEFQEFTLHCVEENGGIALHFKEDSTYDILFVPYHLDQNEDFYFDKEKLENEYNDIVVLSPLESIMKYTESLLVTISDIDSFRRIGRIIEKGMVYANIDFKTCFFCGGSKIHNIAPEGEADVYVCNGCRTKMIDCTCDVTKKHYWVTTIDGYEVPSREFLDPSELYHYRNITEVTKKGDFICPHCKRTHKISDL